MTKSMQGVYLRRLRAQRHRSSELKKIGNFKKENVYPKFTPRHAAWKEEPEVLYKLTEKGLEEAKKLKAKKILKKVKPKSGKKPIPKKKRKFTKPKL